MTVIPTFSSVLSPSQACDMCSLQNCTDPYEVYLRRCSQYQYTSPDYFLNEEVVEVDESECGISDEEMESGMPQGNSRFIRETGRVSLIREEMIKPCLDDG